MIARENIAEQYFSTVGPYPTIIQISRIPGTESYQHRHPTATKQNTRELMVYIWMRWLIFSHFIWIFAVRKFNFFHCLRGKFSRFMVTLIHASNLRNQIQLILLKRMWPTDNKMSMSLLYENCVLVWSCTFHYIVPMLYTLQARICT